MSDHSNLKAKADLPENLWLPLAELQADVKYLFGRVAADGSVAGAMASSVEDKLSQIETACYQLQSELTALKAQVDGAFKDGVEAAAKILDKRPRKTTNAVANAYAIAIRAITQPETEKDESK